MPASARCSLSLAHFFRTFRQVLVDLGRLMFLFKSTPCRTGSGKPLPAQTTGALPGAEGQATTGRRFHPVDDGPVKVHIGQIAVYEPDICQIQLFEGDLPEDHIIEYALSER